MGIAGLREEKISAALHSECDSTRLLGDGGVWGGRGEYLLCSLAKCDIDLFFASLRLAKGSENQVCLEWTQNLKQTLGTSTVSHMLKLEPTTQNPKPKTNSKCLKRSVVYSNAPQGSFNAISGPSMRQKRNLAKSRLLLRFASALQASQSALQLHR